ncbi:hypothetical protein [Rhizobium sp. MHM7A]|uniref:hypothetical protein n=1 Tax=Rhizobium sp. MHM7A TaxID=2583233 RepID=UPI0011058D23|nr:hypothetical protein [Rhizobium sp. MHM7A]TLX16249.1 hypothetical protein FFR93_02665 [Rhizobium sp. MHM7A]
MRKKLEFLAVALSSVAFPQLLFAADVLPGAEPMPAPNFVYRDAFEQGTTGRLPISVLSIIGAETDILAERDITRSVSATSGGADGNSPSDDNPVAMILQGVGEATIKYNQKKKEIEDDSRDFRSVTSLLSGLNGKKAEGVPLITSILANMGTRADEREVKKQTAIVEREYSRSITEVVQAAVASADKATRDKWMKAGIDTPEEASEAMKSLFTSSEGDFFNKFGLVALSKEARDEFINAKTDIVKDALERFAKQTRQERKTDLEKLQGQIADNADQIGKTLKEVQTFRKEIKEQFDGLEKTVKTSIHTMETEVSAVKADVAAVKGDVKAIQSQMWRQMSPRERLAALNEGFLSSVQGQKREELREGLEATVKIHNLRDKALERLGDAGAIGRLAYNLGLPIDIQNFSKNINTASAVVNIASNLALQNWMGAVGGANSLFGGGGGGESAAIMAQLNRIIALQKQTLQKLDELSNQLKDSTDKILSELEKINAKLDLIASNQVDIGYKSRVQSCAEFVSRASLYGMKDGLFPSYEMRMAHFNRDNSTGYEHYKSCRNFLNESKKIDPQGQSFDSTYVVPNIYLESTILRKDATPAEPKYQRMLDITLRSLGEQIDTRCMDRALAMLSDTPRTFVEAQVPTVSCSSGVDKDRHLTSQDQTVNGKLAVDHYMSPLAVRTLVGYALFVAPYDSLQVRKDGYRELATVEDLAIGTAEVNRDDDAVIWPKYYADILKIASAQQTVTAGLYALPFTDNVIATKGKYGAEAGIKFVEVDTTTRECKPSEIAKFKNNDKDKYYTIDNYAAVSCVLAENVWFRSNFIRYLVTKALIQAKMTIPEYAFALRSNDGTHIREALPGLPVKWRKPTDAGASPWVIEIKDAAGAPWELALPTPPEIRSNIVAYHFGADAIFKLRDQIASQNILQSASLDDALKTNGAAFFRAALMSNKAIAQVDLIGQTQE